jgi:negative regulator of flagellin synthesis FlgM
MSMTINSLGSLSAIPPDQKAGRVEQTRGPITDSITISAEASRKADLLRITEMAKAAPDIREARVAELRAKINDPSYLSRQTLEATADRIFDAFFG